MSGKNFPEISGRQIIFLLGLCFSFAVFVVAQNSTETGFPKKIRGYKVYQARVLVQTAKDKIPDNSEKSFDSLVKVGSPQNFKISLSGATFELPLSMNSYKTGGQVDSIAFEDMCINGIRMHVEEFHGPFQFAKDVDTELPNPLKVKIDLAQDPSALLSLKPSLTEFEVTGKVYVFGTFKKFGMKFKRVIPADFKLKTKFSLPLTGAN